MERLAKWMLHNSIRLENYAQMIGTSPRITASPTPLTTATLTTSPGQWKAKKQPHSDSVVGYMDGGSTLSFTLDQHHFNKCKPGWWQLSFPKKVRSVRPFLHNSHRSPTKFKVSRIPLCPRSLTHLDKTWQAIQNYSDNARMSSVAAVLPTANRKGKVRNNNSAWQFPRHDQILAYMTKWR